MSRESTPPRRRRQLGSLPEAAGPAPAASNGHPPRLNGHHSGGGTNGPARARKIEPGPSTPTGKKPSRNPPAKGKPGKRSRKSAAAPEPRGRGKTAMTPLCDKCVALCCRAIALPIDNPEDAADYDNIRWYLMHEGIHVFVEDGQWYLAMATRCKHLQPDNRCGIYETRPRVCRSYSTKNCEWHGGEYDYEELFTSAEQLRQYAKEELGRDIVARQRKPATKPRPRKSRDGKRSVELPVV